MSIIIAIHDAAKNCAEHGAVTTLTLRSGVQITGTVEYPKGTTVMIRFLDGWGTVATDEIAAVESRHGRKMF